MLLLCWLVIYMSQLKIENALRIISEVDLIILSSYLELIFEWYLEFWVATWN